MEGTTFTIASVFDSALDHEAMGESLQAYFIERDSALVKIKPGKQLTWYECADIPTSVYRRFVEAAPEGERNARAFMAGVVQVTGLVDRSGVSRGVPVGPSGHVPAVSGEHRVWTESEMDLFAPVVVEEVGSYIRQRSALPFGCAYSYRPPPSCLTAYAGMISHLAATKVKALLQSSEGAKARPAGRRAKGGGERTSAGATAKATASRGSKKTKRSSAR